MDVYDSWVRLNESCARTITDVDEKADIVTFNNGEKISLRGLVIARKNKDISYYVTNPSKLKPYIERYLSPLNSNVDKALRHCSRSFKDMGYKEYKRSEDTYYFYSGALIKYMDRRADYNFFIRVKVHDSRRSNFDIGFVVYSCAYYFESGLNTWTRGKDDFGIHVNDTETLNEVINFIFECMNGSKIAGTSAGRTNIIQYTARGDALNKEESQWVSNYYHDLVKHCKIIGLKDFYTVFDK